MIRHPPYSTKMPAYTFSCHFIEAVLETGRVSLLKMTTKLQARNSDIGKNLQKDRPSEGPRGRGATMYKV